MTQDIMEQQGQDREIQNVCEEIGGKAKGAYALLLERREAAFAAAIEPLDQEEKMPRQEYVSIGEAAQNLELLLPARAREAQRQADRLMLDGKQEEAAAKLAESEDARTAPEAMKARRREISARIEAIAGERQAIARREFERWYAELQDVIRASEHALFIGLLDKSHDEMYAFQERHQLQGTLAQFYSGLVQNRLLSGLTAPERSAEWDSGHRWYGGRR